MAQQTINVGAAPNDGTGTPLRTAFQYTNSNFSELYTALGGGAGLPGSTNQVIFNNGTNLAGDSGLTFNPTTDLLTAGTLKTLGDTQLANIGILYVGTIGSPKLKVDVAGTGETTIASATITGDLTVDTSTLKVDSANDRVGIKTASPRSPFALDVLGNVALGDSTTTSSVRLKLDCLGTAGNVAIMSFATAGTNKAFFGLSGGYTGDASSDAIIGTDAAGAAIRFYTSDNGVEVARFNSTGNLAFANTKGIDFSATPGTGTSELLNDYEEGTWAIGIAFGGASTGITYSQNTGKYTKVGRLVTVFGAVDLTNKGSATGNASITGLPFSIGLEQT